MRIIVPVVGFAAAGGYRVLSRFASEWIGAGHEVAFVSYYQSAPPYFPTKAPVIWVDERGRAVSECQPPQNGGSFFFRQLRALWHGLEKHAGQSDVILANQSLTAWPVFLARVQAQKHYYIQAFEPSYYFERPGLTPKLVGSLSLSSYFLPLHQIVNSTAYQRHRIVRTQYFVPPGIDLETFHPRSPAWAPGEELVIGCIGRREPNKGTRYVLEAFAKLVKIKPSFRLRVAYGSKLELPALPNLEIIEPTNDTELAAFYRSLDALVSPVTDQLGSPHYPVMEGLASGVPVISTGHQPANSDNAWIVPIHDSQAILTAILEIHQAPNLTRAKIARGLEDIKGFQWVTLAHQMLEYFDAKRKV